MDHGFALRLVIFEYLLPSQKRARRLCLQKALQSVQVYRETHVGGVMEHLLHLSDALLNCRGYPTSFVLHVEAIEKYHRRTGDAIVIPKLMSHERISDPRGGYRIFRHR